MVKFKEVEDQNEVWTENSPQINIMPLDQLDKDGVNIHCINSSEFVVGKQTNFNGPVTIINCENAYTETITGNEKDENFEKEKIVIREKVLSQSATNKIQEMAQGMEHETKPKVTEKLKSEIKKRKILHYLLCLAAIFITIAVIAAIAFTLTSDKSEPTGNKNRTCIPVPKLSRKACMYSLSEDVEECGTEDKKLGSFITLPVPLVVIGQTGDTICFTRDDCSRQLKPYKCENGTQRCNFLVVPEGHFYEDLGWNMTTTLTRRGIPEKSLLICFQGEFTRANYPTFPQIQSTQALIQYGVENGFVSENYTLALGHPTNQFKSVYKIIKTWKNFNETFSENRLSEQVNGGKKHKIYTKQDWGGKPPTSIIEMQLPVPFVFISHTVTSECNGLLMCSPYLKYIQNFHFSLRFSDIAYNFLVDSLGNIYEGRGWNIRNTKGGFENGRNIDIAFMGDFSRDKHPTEDQADGAKFLIEYGVNTGKIAKDYLLFPSNATFATLSPGKHVYEIIKHWPHFTETLPKDDI